MKSLCQAWQCEGTDWTQGPEYEEVTTIQCYTSAGLENMKYFL
jgi:hypothetical protein